jgi:hypothetical protein
MSPRARPRTSLARLVTTVLVAGSASVGFLPLAHAGTSTQKLTPTAEAWYQPNPTCATPAGCVTTDALPAQPPAEVPTTAYPVGSLRVGMVAGQEVARTYLGFSLSLVEQELTAATLDVPLDTAYQDGSIAPDMAKVLVCAFSGSVTPAYGSLAAPPAADCSAKAAATYVATPAPHLHADLAPLLGALSSGAGLALLPDATASGQTGVWQVVFSSHDRADTSKTPPATLGVTLTDLPQQEQEPPVTVPEAQVPQAPPLGGITAPLPTTELPQAPAVGGPAPAVDNGVLPQARTVTVGYAYPSVWLLPLAFLVVVPLVARSLTRDLTPVR